MKTKFGFLLSVLLGVCFLVSVATAADIDEVQRDYEKKLKYQSFKSSDANSRQTTSENSLIRRDDSGGPDEFGYRWVDSNEEGGPEYEWIDISEDGEQLGPSDDWNSGAMDMAFEFDFYGEVYDEIYFCSNGWASFTSNETMHWNEDFELPGYNTNNETAPAMLAVCFSDWNPNIGGSFYYYTDEDMTVLTWEDVPKYDDNQQIWSFQIIIYPNGQIIYQYERVEGGDDDTVIGIQDEEVEIGLEILNHQGGYLEEGLAIKIIDEIAWVSGVVTDLATEAPIEGAFVTLSDGNLVETDADGVYWFNEIGPGVYTISATAFGYNNAVSDEFEIEDMDTIFVDLALPHPEILIDVEEFTVGIDVDEVIEEGFTITNDGNGELEFNMSFSRSEMERDERGDILFDIDISETVGDQRLYGFTLLNNIFYVTGGNNNDDPNYVYAFNLHGELLNTFQQPVDDPSSRGMQGMTNDGEYLYAADGTNIHKFDGEGNVEAVFEGPYNPTTYLAYDPTTGNLWVAATRSNIVEIDMDGETYREMNFEGSIFGLCWHPEDLDGYNLYIVTADNETGVQSIIKANPDADEEEEMFMHVMDFETGEGDEPKDAHITNVFDPLLWAFLTLEADGAPDRLVGVELELNTSWLDVDPMSGMVESGGEEPVSIIFDSEGWGAGAYSVMLNIDHNAITDRIELPITMIVSREYDMTDHFEFQNTGLVHEVFVEDFSIHNFPAAAGDEIGAFTSTGLCAGAAIWAESGVILPIFGDDPGTEEIDGFADGEAFNFRYWDGSADVEAKAQYLVTAGDETFAVFGHSTVLVTAADPNWAEHFEYTWTSGFHEFHITDTQISIDNMLSSAEEGDELGVFVGDLCIGAYKWQAGGTPILAFIDDPDTEEKDGFVENDSAVFRFWNDDLASYDDNVTFTYTSGDTSLLADGFTEGTIHVGLEFDTPKDVDPNLPSVLMLSQAYPNPFNATTNVNFGLPVSGSVRISAYDLQGREVAVLTEGVFEAGYHSIEWNAQNLPSSMYLIALNTANGESRLIKALLLR
ncbi:carboxypeptidase regulatory-like domain-containing protein [Calditrichota bacterium]